MGGRVVLGLPDVAHHFVDLVMVGYETQDIAHVGGRSSIAFNFIGCELCTVEVWMIGEGVPVVGGSKKYLSWTKPLKLEDPVVHLLYRHPEVKITFLEAVQHSHQDVLNNSAGYLDFPGASACPSWTVLNFNPVSISPPIDLAVLKMVARVNVEMSGLRKH